MRMDPHNIVKYKLKHIWHTDICITHPPSPTHLHLSHRHLHHLLHTPHHPLHLHHPLHTSTYPRHLHHLLHTPHHPYTHLYHPFHHPLHTSTIPYTHLHYPLHTPPLSLHTPPLSPTHTSTIPYTHLHHPLHTPPPSPTHTSTISYTRLHHPLRTHYPIHTSSSFVCLPACRIYRSNNYFRCPTSGPGQRPKTFCSKNVLRQKHFVPNPTYALRQIRHTLCAKSDIRSPNERGAGGAKSPGPCLNGARAFRATPFISH